MSHYLRRAAIDVLESEGEALLLLPPDQVVRLSQIATLIFELTSTAQSLDDLAAAVEAEFGAPEDGTTVDALRAILDDLVEARVLEQVDGD